MTAITSQTLTGQNPDELGSLNRKRLRGPLQVPTPNQIAWLPAMLAMHRIEILVLILILDDDGWAKEYLRNHILIRADLFLICIPRHSSMYASRTAQVNIRNQAGRHNRSTGRRTPKQPWSKLEGFGLLMHTPLLLLYIYLREGQASSELHRQRRWDCHMPR